MNLLLSPAALGAMAIGYLLGSIPFGLILTRMAGLGDVRNIGSGNIGATNVLRTGHKGLAALTLLLDALKGTAAVLIAEHVGAGAGIAVLAALLGGLGAFIGHIFPVWLGFKGGKGVATYIGVALGLAWQFAVIFCGLWLLVAFASRFSSLAALVAAILTPLAVWLLGAPAPAMLLAAMSILLILKHRANVDRLLAGQEPRIGAQK